MDQTLAKIRGLKTANDEIIARVEALHEVRKYEYYFENEDFMVQVHEIVHTTPVDEILESFVFSGRMKSDFEDIFNYTIDWTAANWADLKRLNKEMLPIMDKFEAFAAWNARTQAELYKYLHNYEVIQVGLGSVEEQTISEQSKLDRYRRQVDEINKHLQRGIAAFQKQGLRKGKPSEIPQSVANSRWSFFAEREDELSGGDLISIDHADQLVEWYGSGWRLQYKASRDGWTAKRFHAQCDDVGSSSITLIKANGCLFGGYLSIPWRSGTNWLADSQASLFTLTNKHGISPTIFPIKRAQAQFAACSSRSHGPIFGGGSSDILIANNAALNYDSFCNFPTSYTDTTGIGNRLLANSQRFTPSEIEVYIREN